MGSSKKHKKHKSERKSKYEDRPPPSLKLILKVNGSDSPVGSSDSPYNIHHPTSTMVDMHHHSMDHQQQSSLSEHGEKHKKSKKKKKKKDREKRHKHKKDRHHRRESSAEAMLMDDDDSSQLLMTESAQLYYSAMSTASAISSNPVTKPMLPMLDQAKVFHSLQNVPTASSIEHKPDTPLGNQDSPMTPSSISMDSVTREPRTCVLKLKTRSPLAKLLDHLLKALEKRDPHQFFAWPVTDDIAPNYSAIITKPMDFSTIRQKIEENEYPLLHDFTEDFKLMCDNAIRYNHHETVYNKAARRLLQAGLRLLQPEHLTRGPVAIFMKDLTMKELGFDPTIKHEHHDEAYLDSADESARDASVEQPDPQQEERDRRERMKAEMDPKTPYEAFVDNLTADEVLEQVQKAARDARARLHKKRASNMGFLRSHTDGSTSMTILVGESGIPEKTKKLGEFTGKLSKGTGLLQSFREDRRNIVKFPKALDYGSFSSFAPTFDSRFTNLSKEETDLMLNTYGDDNGVNYGTSIGRFTRESAYGNTLANRLLDLLTNGEHSKTTEIMEESEQLKQCQKEVEGMLPNYQKEAKRLEGVNIDFEQLKSLKELGVDTRFLNEFEKSLKGSTGVDMQTKLDTNTSLIEQLHQVQHDRLSTPIQQHLSFVHQPNKQEVDLADQITSNLTNIAKKLPPSAIAPSAGIRKAMGLNSVGIEDSFRKISTEFHISSGRKESHVDTTPLDMDLEPPAPASLTFDNELRELLGTD